MKRVLCLYMPFLAVERAGRTCSLSADEPLALVERAGQSQRVAACNRHAASGGIVRGQSLAQAKAIMPTLAIQPHDPLVDRAQLERLAGGMLQFAPIVQPVETSVLLADITGCERLFGGEENLLGQTMAYIETIGFSVRGAVAGSVGAAWAIAHGGADRAVVIEPGQEMAAVAELGTWTLRLEPELASTLAQLGIETVGDLMHLPRSALASRFGRTLLQRLDQAQGVLDEPIEPFRPAPPPSVRMGLAFPTDRQDVLTEASKLLVTRVAQRLEAIGQGLNELQCTFYREQAGPVTASLWLTRPTRQVEHLMTLLAERIERLDMSIPITAISMHVSAMAAMPGRQGQLFDQPEIDHEAATAELLDTLANRLGPEAVLKAEPADDHQPEYAYRCQPVTANQVHSGYHGQAGCHASVLRSMSGPDGWHHQAQRRHVPDEPTRLTSPDVTSGCHPTDRPVRLLSSPQSIDVIAGPAEGRPAWFRWRGQDHTVTWATGPERIETGWWRGLHIRRDYYVVQDQPGGRFWLFRDRQTHQWFVHGCF